MEGNYQLAHQAISGSRNLEIHTSREGLLADAVLVGISGGDQAGFGRKGAGSAERVFTGTEVESRTAGLNHPGGNNFWIN